MRKKRKFKLSAAEIVQLLDRPMGSGIASDHITVDGHKVGFMCRESPDNQIDSGWRFLSGEESQEYIDQPDNLAIYDLNTIANYDRAVIPYLESAVGSQLERVPDTDEFRYVEPQEPEA